MARIVGGAAVRQREGVAMYGGRDVGLRSPVAVVAVPLLVGGAVMLHLDQDRTQTNREERKVRTNRWLEARQKIQTATDHTTVLNSNIHVLIQVNSRDAQLMFSIGLFNQYSISSLAIKTWRRMRGGSNKN